VILRSNETYPAKSINFDLETGQPSNDEINAGLDKVVYQLAKRLEA